MTVLMSDVNASLIYYEKEQKKRIQVLVERLLSEEDLSFSKMDNITAILDMPDEEFNFATYNSIPIPSKGKLLWNPSKRWLHLYRKREKTHHSSDVYDDIKAEARIERECMWIGGKVYSVDIAKLFKLHMYITLDELAILEAEGKLRMAWNGHKYVYELVEPELKAKN